MYHNLNKNEINEFNNIIILILSFINNKDINIDNNSKNTILELIKFYDIYKQKSKLNLFNELKFDNDNINKNIINLYKNN